MHRWERSHGHIGVVAPSWLTFEVHRPYFDGAESPLTAMQARGAVLAASLYAAGDPQAPRFSMVMPASYRQLLIEESRLTAYRVATPADLPQELASPAWQDLARAYRDRDELDAAGRAGALHLRDDHPPRRGQRRQQRIDRLGQLRANVGERRDRLRREQVIADIALRQGDDAQQPTRGA